MRLGLLPLALALFLAAQGTAAAACPERLGVAFGDTLASIAQACGVNVEALRQLNPGLTAGTLRQGMFVRVPRPALASGQVERRGGRVEPTTPLVRSPAAGGTPTVILPPEPDYVPVNPFKPALPFPNHGTGLPGLGVHPSSFNGIEGSIASIDFPGPPIWHSLPRRFRRMHPCPHPPPPPAAQRRCRGSSSPAAA